jgi:hypothetical protein
MKTSLTIYFLFITSFLFAQNLVPNPSFENFIICPNTDDIENAPPWFNPTGPYTSPNLFNSCAPQWPSSNFGVPLNGWGFQEPRTGNGYAGGIIVYDEVSPPEREYISVKLNSPLIALSTYCIRFYVSVCYLHSLPNGYMGSRYAIDRIGAYISDTIIQLNTNYIIPVIPQIQNPTGNILSDTLNWMLISGTYNANGGEQYITIGNFYPESNTNKIQISDSSNLSFGSFYYIDDVYVIDCNDTLGISENDDTNNLINVYPNPASIELTIDITMTNKYFFELYDLFGAKRKAVTLDCGSQTKNINLTDIDNGLYFYSVVDRNGSRIKTGKLLIIK